MKGWIFNASPLILLGKIHQLHLIEVLSPNFRIPRPVVAEIGVGRSDDPTIQRSNGSHLLRLPPISLTSRQLHHFLLNGI